MKLEELKVYSKSDLWYGRYIKLLNYAKNKTYDDGFHNHHILPKSIFPQYKNDKDNLVKLSYRLHYLAHYILWRMTERYDMAMAFHLMSTITIKNSRLYESVLNDLYKNRCGKMVSTNIETGVNELVGVECIGDTHRHLHIGFKWWMKEGNVIFTNEDLSLSGYVNSHNFDCKPNRVYWTIDENGNRKRSSNKNDSIKGVAPWEKGFNKINLETTKFLDLTNKKTVYLDKIEPVPETYYYSNGINKKTIIYLYNGIYYFGYTSLPREINIDRKMEMEDLKKIYIPTVDSISYRSKKTNKDRKTLIENFGGLSYYDIGVRSYYLYDDNFKFDLSHKIHNFNDKNKHQ